MDYAMLKSREKLKLAARDKLGSILEYTKSTCMVHHVTKNLGGQSDNPTETCGAKPGDVES